MVAHRALAARAARPSMRFERRTNCREATPWESWKRYTGRCSNHRRSRVVFLSTLFYAAIVVVCAYITYIHIYIHIHIYTRIYKRAFSLISTLRRRESPLLSKRAHDPWAFLKRFCSLRRIVEFFVWKSIRGKPRLCRFCLLRILLFPFPASFHGRYRLPEVKKACLRGILLHSTCPRSSSGHACKSNKCIFFRKTNIVKDCYTIIPVHGVDHYHGNTSI